MKRIQVARETFPAQAASSSQILNWFDLGTKDMPTIPNTNVGMTMIVVRANLYTILKVSRLEIKRSCSSMSNFLEISTWKPNWSCRSCKMFLSFNSLDGT
ncbi:hypothetical protein WICPIJ_007609 [Wickerhamomyces pijperi]|uniref:Uncharacterized protein n=1 Tax=Wickerhamomyces pijperi TaxID=599730 RepID=A0A9P8PZH6_WICPI|nr:hypothetical protein WICPIJ_007609 [Wickerhamomyces pijperi]